MFMKIILAAFLLVLTNCGDKVKKGDSSAISVQFEDATTSLSLQEGSSSNIAPEVMKLRPLAVRISTDNNGGYMVWGSSSCPGTKETVKINDKEFEYHSEAGCKQSEDNDWIDLTAGTTAVNAELNSQVFPVPPGDYAWVSIIMCEHGVRTDGESGWIEDSGVSTMAFKGGYMTEESAQYGCSPIGNYTAMTPVSIPEGGTITLKINYDLSKMIHETFHVLGDGVTPLPWSDTFSEEGDCKYVQSEDGTELKAQYCPSAGYQTITATIEQHECLNLANSFQLGDAHWSLKLV